MTRQLHTSKEIEAAFDRNQMTPDSVLSGHGSNSSQHPHKAPRATTRRQPEMIVMDMFEIFRQLELGQTVPFGLPQQLHASFQIEEAAIDRSQMISDCVLSLAIDYNCPQATDDQKPRS